MFDISRTVRRNRGFDHLDIICGPEFENLFGRIFPDARINRIDTPKVSIHIDNDDEKDAELNRRLRDVFKWKIEDDDEEEGLDEGDAYEDADEEENEEPYIHEPDVIYAEDNEDDESEEKVPPSIFDMLSSGKKFSDIIPAKPEHTEIYKQAFGLDDDGNEIEPPEEDEDVETEMKNPFVFIANRLTFLAQTVQPIIFDTSLIETGSDYIKIAVNEDKTFPKIRNFDELGLITCKLNCCQTIRDEIGEFIKGTEYTDIFCFPEFISRDGPGTDVWAIKFICYKRK